MNHTTKFRGKSLSTGEWVYGYYYVAPKRMYADKVDHCIVDIYGAIFAVDPKTVGQYIGIKDKNEKEIYADDIVTSTLVNSKGRKHKVEWREDLLGWSIQGHTPSRFTEVIGNVTDNPDLLTQ